MSSPNRLQDDAVERISLQREGEALQVRSGYLDDHIEVTTRGGASWRVSAEGTVQQQKGDYSVRFYESYE